MFLVSNPGRHIGVALTLASTLLALTANVAVVEAGTSAKVTLRCYSNPEKVTITNTGTTTFAVKKVGSTYQPYSYEPFSVSKTLAPGQSVTYQTGSAASGANKLTGTYIFNDNGLDGVKVRTNLAIYTKRC